MTAMTDAEIIAAYDRPDIPPALSRLLHLARIGAKVVAADGDVIERMARVMVVEQGTAWDGLDAGDHGYWRSFARAALASVGE